MRDSESNQVSVSSIWPSNFVGWLELILKFMLIFGSIGAVLQYSDVKKENRVKQTMEFVDSFNTGQILESQLRLDAFWAHYHEEIIELKQKRIADNKKKELIRSIVFPIVDNNIEQQKDIDFIVRFFANLHICVDNGICDKAVARSFFIRYAEGFFDFYQSWIDYKRKITPYYACELEAFLHQIKCQ